MDRGVYYQILEMGVLYEKGRGSGKIWRLWERQLLRDEISFWRILLDCASWGKNGQQCDEIIFGHLERLAKKYKLPHYIKALEHWEELYQRDAVFERDKEEEYKLTQFMERLLMDAGDCLQGYGNKERFYRILRVLHNLPKALHGKNILDTNFKSISYRDALRYAQGCMDKKMEKEYAEFYAAADSE